MNLFSCTRIKWGSGRRKSKGHLGKCKPHIFPNTKWRSTSIFTRYLLPCQLPIGKGKVSPWQFVQSCPTLGGGAHLRFQPTELVFCLKTIFHGHAASATRHGTPLSSHHSGTDLSTRILHAFEPLGWRKLGQATCATPRFIYKRARTHTHIYFPFGFSPPLYKAERNQMGKTRCL